MAVYSSLSVYLFGGPGTEAKTEAGVRVRVWASAEASAKMRFWVGMAIEA